MLTLVVMPKDIAASPVISYWNTSFKSVSASVSSAKVNLSSSPAPPLRFNVKSTAIWVSACSSPIFIFSFALVLFTASSCSKPNPPSNLKSSDSLVVKFAFKNVLSALVFK